ncbi:MAG: PD-(D/E)XK nuclease family transposase, partial [Treponema sp.]|nr:PD-(D/E)XK nuclease family transposase [Treponema sp.]
MRNYVEKSIEEKWEEASLSNNFIFCRVMSENLDLCKEFLEMLLNIKIESIRLAQPEATLNVEFYSKGIRLDVFVKDENDRMFDIEMQVIGNDYLPLRARYYQSVLDISYLRSGQVRVLMGSTFKMGAGMNVQDRLIALHDLDCP